MGFKFVRNFYTFNFFSVFFFLSFFSYFLFSFIFIFIFNFNFNFNFNFHFHFHFHYSLFFLNLLWLLNLDCKKKFYIFSLIILSIIFILKKLVKAAIISSNKFLSFLNDFFRIKNG